MNKRGESQGGMEQPLNGTTVSSSHKGKVAKWTLEGLKAEVHVKDGEENKSVFVVLHGLPNGAPRSSRLGVVDAGMQELKF